MTATEVYTRSKHRSRERPVEVVLGAAGSLDEGLREGEATTTAVKGYVLPVG